jgi:EmrB/QacA subfamily drug resistance transporter
MVMLDTTIVNVALPYIQRDLGFTQAGLTWVVNAYVIAYASFLLVAGRLGDLIGRRKVFLAGVFLFTVASAGSGFATGADHLIIGRFLQGLGGSLATGVIIAIIVTDFQKPLERAQAMSLFTLVIASGGSLGLLAGGLLTQWASWHWTFFINVPIGIATIVAGALLIRENEGLGLRGGLDVLGAVLVTGALVVGVYGIVTAADNGWTSAHTVGLAGASLILLAAFVLWESRLANPLMPLRVLAVRSLTGASVARGLVFGGMFTNFFIGALYMQRIQGFSALQTGFGFLPTTLAIGVLSGSGLAARLMGRFGARSLAVAGMAVLASGLLVLSQAGMHTAYFPNLFVAYLLLGIGGGTGFLPLLTIAMSEVAPADAGLASGFSNVTMQVGGALGLAALGTISTEHAQALFAGGDPLPVALIGGYQLGFVLAAIAVMAGLAVIVTVLRGARPRPAAVPSESLEIEEEVA